MKTIILALGNPLRGDDGVGTAVLQQLQETAVFPPNITLLDGGTAGLETALLFQGADRVLVIDAADMNSTPGTWRRLNLSDITLTQEAQMSGTLHDAGFAEAVALADALGILPAEIILFAVQPATMAWTSGLSPLVQAAVPQLCQAVQSEITAVSS